MNKDKFDRKWKEDFINRFVVSYPDREPELNYKDVAEIMDFIEWVADRKGSYIVTDMYETLPKKDRHLSDEITKIIKDNLYPYYRYPYYRLPQSSPIIE